MTWASAALSIAFAILTACLLVRSPLRESRVRLHRIDEAPLDRRPGSAARWRGRIVVSAAVGGVLVVAGMLFGARGVLIGVAGCTAGGTVVALVRRSGQRRAEQTARGDVAQACSLLASQVRIGQVPVEALRSAAEDCPVLLQAQQTAAIGGDPTEVWFSQANRPGLGGLGDLARAWRLSATTGAALVGSLEQVAAALHADQALRLVIISEAAAPRATGKIMAGLPLVGIGLGYAMGGDPLRFLFTSPPGAACLAAGAVSACLGVLWMEKVSDRVLADRG